MQFFLILIILNALLVISCSRRQEPEISGKEIPHTAIKPSVVSSSNGQQQSSHVSNTQKNGVDIPEVFITVQPSIDELFVYAFNCEAKEKEWETMITGVVLISPDWEEVNDNNTQKILGRTRTAAILAKGEEGQCIAFERYTIFQAYKNGSFIGKPRGYSYTSSKDIDCNRCEHLKFKSSQQTDVDEQNE